LVNEHVAHCVKCSKELRELHRVISTLKHDKETMCPEPWELCLFAQSGQDPTGRLARHVAECHLCREDVEMCKIVSEDQTLPQDLWARGKGLLPGVGVDRGPAIETQGRLSALFDWLSSLLSVPYVAVAAAAVLIVLVIIHPREGGLPVLAVSPVTWGQEGGPVRLMAPESAEGGPTEYGEASQRVVATLIFLKDFNKPVKQSTIDAFYTAVQPGTEVAAQSLFLPPSALKNALAEGTVKTDSRANLLGSLRHNLHVSEVLSITIIPRDNVFDIDVEVIDTATGRTLEKKTETGVSESEISLKLQLASAIVR